MRLNANTKLIGERVILVPYEKHHVEKYHQWMENDELRRLTGSERLSLEDEYIMQMKWREDDDKCTFIILSRKLIDSGADEIGSMVGDVNIFIRDGVGELEIMIAEPECRSQGLGREATQMMLKYAVETLGLNEFQVKITDDNTSSISLFQKLGFVIVSHSDVFREQTLTANFEKLQNIISQQCLHYGTYSVDDFR